MTAPAYHVGQILYHRANGERAIVTTRDLLDKSCILSAGVGQSVLLYDNAIDIEFSTEPVFIQTASKPDLTFRPVNHMNPHR